MPLSPMARDMQIGNEEGKALKLQPTSTGRTHCLRIYVEGNSSRRKRPRIHKLIRTELETAVMTESTYMWASEM